MKRLLICLFLLFPVCAFAFDVKQLAECSFVTTKVFTKSDSMDVNRYIQSTQGLVELFGEKRVDSKTQYVYQGDKQIELQGDSSWRYFFPESWGGRGKGKLIYNQNDVMRSGAAGDTLVVARCEEKILLLLIKQNHPMANDVYSLIGVNEMIDPEIQPKPSLWKRLFGGSDSQAEKLAKVEMAVEMEAPKVTPKKKSRSKKATEPDMDLNPDSYENIPFEAHRHKINKRVVLIGTPRIVDGDTIILEGLFNIRVIGTDTPESKQNCWDSNGHEYACGRQATEHLKKLVGNGRVKCEIRGIGRFGRHTGLCYNMKDVNLNKTMVRDGFAVISTYPPILFEKEEIEARKEKVGVWQGTLRHPHCFRHQKKQDWKAVGLCEDGKLYDGWDDKFTTKE